ncbi:DUF4365 domain-containing protein [Desertivibrio insolitus]|uniref:DUF4365 domain-containing protein n=1 Tax=Herbiconiux sp. SYSU D00978 TaxID=2812562 RepID=UPI001A973CAD|nr:DUF4365 domain-containing protein [Herbiconiux sp. SYSU D00978]
MSAPQPISTWDRPRYTSNGAPFGDLHSGHTKEQYSVAFVHALATRARCKVQGLEVDDEQVDVTIRQKAKHLHYSRTMVDVQLKCTSRDVVKDDGVHFPLTRKQYDGLRERGIAAKILVVLVVEDEFDDWFTVTNDELLMRGSAYWVLMDDQPEITTQSTTVLLPAANRFNVDQLLDMLQRIGQGGKP